MEKKGQRPSRPPVSSSSRALPDGKAAADHTHTHTEVTWSHQADG